MAVVNKTVAKSRVATKTALKKTSFNWKTLTLVAGVIVVALGFLYYQLSKAATVAVGTKVWYADSFQSFNVTDGYGGVRATLPGSTPATTWYAQEGSFRIAHQNLGAGTYCAMPATILYGGGEAVVTLSVFSVNGTNRVKAASTTSSCVQVGADNTYPNREFELSVTGGSASIGAVRFIANSAGTSGDFAWRPSAITIDPSQANAALKYGTLQSSWSPYIVSKSVPSGGTATSPGGEYLYVQVKPVVGTANYCIEASSSSALSIGFDGNGVGARDVNYIQTPAGTSGFKDFRVCQYVTIKDVTKGLQIYITGEYKKEILLNLITRDATVGDPSVTPTPTTPPPSTTTTTPTNPGTTTQVSPVISATPPTPANPATKK